MASDKTTILIVEDEPAIAALISFAVKEANWHGIAVGSAEEAWDIDDELDFEICDFLLRKKIS